MAKSDYGIKQQCIQKCLTPDLDKEED